MSNRTHKIILCAAALACAAAVLPGGAAAATAYQYDPNLSAWVRGSLESATIDQGTKTKRLPKWVHVRCYADRAAFENVLLRMGNTPWQARLTVAYYVWPRYGGGDASPLNVRAGTCNLARQFVQGFITQDTAGAFHTLLHESLHRQGFHNERETELFAVTSMDAAGWLSEFSRKLHTGGWTDKVSAWEQSRSAGDRAMRLSWLQSQRYIDPSYLSPWSTVTGLLSKESWADRLPFAARA
jgi:hypothetical protein